MGNNGFIRIYIIAVRGCMDYKGQREGFVGWITRQLIGIELRGNGEKQNGIHLDGERPLDRFFTGFLFPIVEQEDILEGEEEEEDDDDELVSESENKTKPVKKEKRYIPPSSAGFSFHVNCLPGNRRRFATAG